MRTWVMVRVLVPYVALVYTAFFTRAEDLKIPEISQDWRAEQIEEKLESIRDELDRLSDNRLLKWKIEQKCRLNKLRRDTLKLIRSREYLDVSAPAHAETQFRIESYVNEIQAMRDKGNFISKRLSSDLREDIMQCLMLCGSHDVGSRQELIGMNSRLDLLEIQYASRGILEFPLDREELDRINNNKRIKDYNKLYCRSRDEDKAGGLETAEYTQLQLINDYRELLGLTRLVIDKALIAASRRHSENMLKAGGLWHAGEDGTPQSRAEEAGFGGTYIGENVAEGDAFNMWYTSPGHHKNMVDNYTCVGLAVAGTYWTLLLGIDVDGRYGKSGDGEWLLIDSGVISPDQGNGAAIEQKDLAAGRTPQKSGEEIREVLVLSATTLGIDLKISVAKVLEGSSLYKAGLRKGDVLVAVNGKKVVNDLDIVRARLLKINRSGRGNITVRRGGRLLRISISSFTSDEH